jgi:hypothetical protein
MEQDRKKILEMLSAGKISVDEAERLIGALGSSGEAVKMSKSAAGYRYLRVLVEESGPDADRVNIRVPLSLIRAGLRWASLIPQHAQLKVNEALKDQGIDMDFAKMTRDDIEELISNIGELTVEVEGKDKVRVFCE